MCTIFVIHNKHLVVKQNFNFQFDPKYIFSTGNIAKLKHLFKNNSEFKTTSNANAALKFEIQIDIMATTASLLR